MKCHCVLHSKTQDKKIEIRCEQGGDLHAYIISYAIRCSNDLKNKEINYLKKIIVKQI